jgi:hypothetical protein
MIAAGEFATESNPSVASCGLDGWKRQLWTGQLDGRTHHVRRIKSFKFKSLSILDPTEPYALTPLGAARTPLLPAAIPLPLGIFLSLLPTCFSTSPLL